MAYNKTTWVDFETKLTAANLNNLEVGLEAAAAKADANANIISGWGGEDGPVTKVPVIEQSISEHNERLNTIELDLYDENNGIAGRLATAESDINGLELNVSNISQSHGTRLSSIETGLSSHTSNKNNPHQVTPAQLGVYTQSEVDSRLSAGTIQLHLDSSDSYYSTITMSDMYTDEQRVLITATKSGSDSYSYYVGGANSLWYLSEDSIADVSVDVENDMHQFSDLLSNCSYEIIDKTLDDFSTYTPPESYISSMRYIHPDFVDSHPGWALNYSTDAAYGSFVTIILYSPSQHRYFLVPTGNNGNTHEHLVFHILDNRYLLVKGNFVYHYTFDLERYGDDLEFYSIGFNGGTDNSDNDTSCIYLKQTYVYCTYFVLDTFGGSSIIPFTWVPLANREYAFDIKTGDTGGVFTTYGYDYQAYAVDLTMQYAKNDSGLVALGKNIPVNQEELDRELDIKIKRALFDLISTGTGDPDASTPGRLYFKYLE